MTKSFEGSNGEVKKINCVKVDDEFKEIPNSEFSFKS